MPQSLREKVEKMFDHPTFGGGGMCCQGDGCDGHKEDVDALLLLITKEKREAGERVAKAVDEKCFEAAKKIDEMGWPDRLTVGDLVLKIQVAGLHAAANQEGV